MFSKKENFGPDSFSTSYTLEIYFILVNPVVPENVGFVCRTLKNMGQHRLRIVGSDAYTYQGAKNTAYESHDLLEKIEAFDTLQAAISDIDLVIGTTGKPRKLRYEVLSSTEISKFISEKSQITNSVAIVFGSETNGLSREDENLCDVLSSIPMNTTYPSINLSHSVMVYAYELFKRFQKASSQEVEKGENGEIFRALKEQSSDLLIELKMLQQQPGLYRRIMDKIAMMGEADSRLVLSLMRYLRKNNHSGH